MSTRAGIIIKDGYSESHYYRHSDGYPKGTLPTLEIFLDWVKKGRICDNTMQSAGWLPIIGAIEYETLPKSLEEGPEDWKCGAYEPTDNVSHHGDLEYIYTIDLLTKKITHRHL